MKIVFISDMHGDIKLCKKGVKLANKEKAHIILNGDLMNWELKHPSLNFKRTLKILLKCKQKVFAIPGSHEDGKDYIKISDHKFYKYDNIIDINKKNH